MEEHSGAKHVNWLFGSSFSAHIAEMQLRDWLQPILYGAEAPPEKSLLKSSSKELWKNKMVVILNH